MVLTDSYLYRVTGGTSCVVYFDNVVTQQPDSVSIPNGSIYYVTHYTGSSISPTVVSGTSELITTTPTVFTFSACCPSVGITDIISVLGDTTSYLLSPPGFSYYFSALTNVSEVTSLYPCELQGCFEVTGSGGTNTDYFYSCYERDPSVAGSCIECTTITHPLDPCFFAITGCCYSDFCLNTLYLPYSGYDGNYVSAGTYDGYSYYSGGTTPGFIYFSTGSSYWCLSTSLGGSCDLTGAKPCQNVCPDICDDIFVGNLCPTPTPSPTVNCSLNDFTALFDCDVIPTPTPTPTQTSTPTPTPSVTPTIDPCTLRSVSFVVQPASPTPTPTMTPTPSATTPPKLCVVSGDVTYNTLSGFIICPGETLLFRDCKDNTLEFVTAEFVSPFSFGLNDVLSVYLNGNTSVTYCIEFMGSTSKSPTDIIEIITVYPSGTTACENCYVGIPSPTPTKTPTPTPTVTMTMTPSQTLPSAEIFFIYKYCDKASTTQKFVVQTINVNNVLVQFASFGWFPYDPANPVDTQLSDNWECWEYEGSISVLPTTNPQAVAQVFIDSLYPTPYTNTIVFLGSVDYFTTTPSVPNLNLFDFGPNNLGYPPAVSIPGFGCRNCQSNSIDTYKTIYVYKNCSSNNVVYQYVEALQTTFNVNDVFVATDPVNRPQCWQYLGSYQGLIDADHIPSLPTPVPIGGNFPFIQFNYVDFFNPPISLYGSTPFTITLDPITGNPFFKCSECIASLG